MKRYFVILLTLFIMGAFQNCSEVRFSTDTGADNSSTGTDDGPTTQPPTQPPTIPTPSDPRLGEDDFVQGNDYSLAWDIPAETNKVDILFSIDTSSSMEEEQKEIGAKFQSFIDTLNSKGLDWRVAVTTMDIYPQSLEQGALGALIPFQDASGASYQFLDSSVANAQALFEAAVQRPINCHIVQTNCNWVERGTFNVNLYLDKIAADPTYAFNRAGAHFSVVYLSDEDVKSFGKDLELYDLPQKLVANVQQTLSPQTFSVHSIILRPGDTACFGNGGLNYGNTYSQLTFQTKGSLGNICASDYTGELQNIGNVIAAKTKTLSLPCYPDPATLVVTLTPDNNTWVLNGNQLEFANDLAAGTNITADFTCMGNP